MEHAMTQLSKEQYRKLMKRPSMSELEDVIHRRNRIDSNVLEKEQLYVDKLVKMHLSEHRKKKQDFVKSRNDSIANSRKSFDSSYSSESFQKLSILNPQSKRGSLQYTSRKVSLQPPSKRGSLQPPSRRASLQQSSRRGSIQPPSHRGSLQPPSHRGSLQNESSPFFPSNMYDEQPERRRSSVWEDLSTPKTHNRQLEIRRKLYEEFNMPESTPTRRRPWSPDDQEEKIQDSESPHRRMSEPITYLSDRLSEEMEERLAYITGRKPRHSVAVIPNTMGLIAGNRSEADTIDVNDNKVFTQSEDNTLDMGAADDTEADTDGRGETGENASELQSFPAGGLMKRKVRRHSEVVKPDILPANNTGEKTTPRRRFSETTMRGKILPPLVEKK